MSARDATIAFRAGRPSTSASSPAPRERGPIGGNPEAVSAIPEAQTAARGSMQPLATMMAGSEFVARARSCGERAEVGVHRLEERGGHLAVVPRQQHALEADVGAPELVLTVRFDPRMKRDRSPEDLGQPIRGDLARRPAESRQRGWSGTSRGTPTIMVTCSGPGPDSRSRSISWIARSIAADGTGLVLFGQAEGHVGPGAGACPRTAQRRGDPTGTRRIDSGQATTESQGVRS